MTTTTTKTPAVAPWAALSRIPRKPIRAKIAEVLFRNAVRGLPVRVLLPDGSQLGSGGPGSPAMLLVRPATFYHRLGASAMIGFGEAYMAGDWTSDDPAALLAPFAQKMSTLVPPALHKLRALAENRRPATERNSVDHARQNIHHHYDLSNDLFAAFLDPSMTYSAAWFDQASADTEDLATAQARKIDGILDYAGVGEGTEVLEIGTGWGSLALRAAARGAHVTSVTISPEQRTLALKRIAEAGYADRADVLLRDYREVTGSFDAVVSIEMLEAVGREYWPEFFTTVDALLRPGGRVGLQTITMPHERMLATRNAYTWIHKYIFPGGVVPSVTAIEQILEAQTALRITDRRTLGLDYARTLRRWRETFGARWSEISTLGFDETFRRMWEFYLAYSEAGFQSGYLDDWQLSMVKS